ncbi:MAG TPA: phospho-N-acetylmuramoyl-pentapeptide-transferase [Acidimicrobiia bacterium]|jgi:phospho-N-acetylmuramoyl-pentapeptide-transferase|nr:phospho-N-acetylmuramoyl-pentapeptide-transferase [Acidimicrobiia bacterium]
MIALLLSASVAFLLSVFGTPFLIRLLRAKGIGQTIRDDGPFRHPHAAKAGTPTMGGIAIIASAFVGYVVAHVRTEQLRFARAGVTLMLLIVALGVVGFVDDYLGVRKGRNLGLRKRGKSSGLLAVAVGFALLALRYVDTSTNLSFTRVVDLDLGTWLWAAWAILIIVGSANAVNITDGMDGLASGAATLVFFAFTVIAFWQFRHPAVYATIGMSTVPEGFRANSLDLAVVAAGMAGACAGFLWWNAAPARIFMGDTGSLALGGGMAGLALLTNTDLLLPILGGLFVVETLSVIAQVVAFRGFHRRVLRMAPVHHHYEVGGWPEFTVIVRFWLFAGLCVAFGLGLFYADFIRIPGVID